MPQRAEDFSAGDNAIASPDRSENLCTEIDSGFNSFRDTQSFMSPKDSSNSLPQLELFDSQSQAQPQDGEGAELPQSLIDNSPRPCDFPSPTPGENPHPMPPDGVDGGMTPKSSVDGAGDGHAGPCGNETDDKPPGSTGSSDDRGGGGETPVPSSGEAGEPPSGPIGTTGGGSSEEVPPVRGGVGDDGPHSTRGGGSGEEVPPVGGGPGNDGAPSTRGGGSDEGPPVSGGGGYN